MVLCLDWIAICWTAIVPAIVPWCNDYPESSNRILVDVKSHRSSLYSSSPVRVDQFVVCCSFFLLFLRLLLVLSATEYQELYSKSFYQLPLVWVSLNLHVPLENHTSFLHRRYQRVAYFSTKIHLPVLSTQHFV